MVEIEPFRSHGPDKKSIKHALYILLYGGSRIHVAPVRAKGFDHTTQGAYAVAAGVSKGGDLFSVG